MTVHSIAASSRVEHGGVVALIHDGHQRLTATLPIPKTKIIQRIWLIFTVLWIDMNIYNIFTLR